MPQARYIGHRVRSGTYAVGNITSTYAITSYPVQNDQDSFISWSLDGRLTTPPARARRTLLSNGSIREDGYWHFNLGFSYLTFGMVSYLQTNWFGSSSTVSNSVSVMVYNTVNSAVYLNCKLHQPEWGIINSEYAPGGYKNVIFLAEQGVVIT